jgi:hypothetical protein
VSGAITSNPLPRKPKQMATNINPDHFDKDIEYKGVILSITGTWEKYEGDRDTPSGERIDIDTVKTEHGDDIYELLTMDQLESIKEELISND